MIRVLGEFFMRSSPAALTTFGKPARGMSFDCARTTVVALLSFDKTGKETRKYRGAHFARIRY